MHDQLYKRQAIKIKQLLYGRKLWCSIQKGQVPHIARHQGVWAPFYRCLLTGLLAYKISIDYFIKYFGG